jgi:ABC-2 type transport system permease protein
VSSLVPAPVDAMLAILRRDAIVFVSYRGRFASQTLALVFNLALFFYLSHIISISAFHSSSAYFSYVVVGLAILQVLIATLGQAPTTLRQELVSGSFEPIVLSPLGPVWGTVGLLLFPAVVSFVSAVLMLLFGVLLFGLQLKLTALAAIPVALVASVAFMPFGLLLCAATVAVKQVLSGAQFIVAGLALVGGLYFPISILPEWIRWTSEVQPLTPAADVLRHLLTGSALRQSLLEDIAKLVGFAAVGFPLALALLGRSIAYSRRRGTIIEY